MECEDGAVLPIIDGWEVQDADEPGCWTVVIPMENGAALELSHDPWGILDKEKPVPTTAYLVIPTQPYWPKDPSMGALAVDYRRAWSWSSPEDPWEAIRIPMIVPSCEAGVPHPIPYIDDPVMDLPEDRRAKLRSANPLCALSLCRHQWSEKVESGAQVKRLLQDFSRVKVFRPEWLPLPDLRPPRS